MRISALALILTLALTGCRGAGGGSLDTSATLTGVAVAAQLTLAVDSGDPVAIERSLTRAGELVQVWVGGDDPDAKALAELVQVATSAWTTYLQTGEGDWRSAVLALLDAINEYELQKLLTAEPAN